MASASRSWLVAALAAAACLASVEATFPVLSMTVTAADMATLLTGNGQGPNVAPLAEQLVNRALSQVLRSSNARLDINQGDITMHFTPPQQVIREGCHVDIRARAHLRGTVKRASSFTFGLANGGTVFGNAVVHSGIGGNGELTIQIGKSFFSRCFRLGRALGNVGINLDGDNHLEARLKTRNVRVTRNGGKRQMRFNLDFDLLGKAVNWDMSRLQLSSCNLKILGIPLLDVCKLIPIRFEWLLNGLFKKVVKITSPVLIRKMEDLVRSKIGSEIVIDLI